MRGSFIPKIISVFVLFLALTYNACGKFEVGESLSNISSLGDQDSLQFNRASIPEFVSSGFLARGTCLGQVSIQVENLPAVTLACNSGIFTYDVQLPGGDGPKVILVTGTGANNRELRDSVTVIKDTLAPTVAILNVVPQGSSLMISGSCESNLPLTFGGDIQSISSNLCLNNLFQFTATLTSTVGLKRLEIAQLDKAGNRGFVSYPWTPDTTPPSLSVSSPVANGFVRATTTVAGLCETGLPVNIGGTALVAALTIPCAAGTFSTGVNIIGGDGAKTVIVSQTDASLNESKVIVAVTKDTVAPVLTIATPMSGANILEASITLSGTCESGSPIIVQGAGVSSELQLACMNNQYSSVVVLSSGNGQKVIEVKHTDLAGNSTNLSRTVSKSTASTMLSIVQPLAAAFTKGAVTVTGNCDNGGALAFSGDIVPTAGLNCANSSFSKAITLSSGEGAKTITVKQTLNSIDSLVSRGVIKDSVAPTVIIAQPVEGAVVLTKFTVSGSCETGIPVVLSGSGLATSISISCNDNTFSGTVTSAAGNGTKVFTATQTDGAGNVATVNRNVSHDTSSSTLTILSPMNGAYVMGSVTLTGKCMTGTPVVFSGTGLSANINANCSGGMYSQSVTLSNGEGPKSISIKQTDNVGNVATVNLSVNKDTMAPVLTISDPPADTKAEAGLSLKGACENGLQIKASGTGLASVVSATCDTQMYSLLITFSAGDGNKDVVVSSSDAAGNTTTVNRRFVKGVVPVIVDFTIAKAVITQYCLTCHSPGKQAGSISFALSTQDEFVTKGFVVAGKPDQSKMIYRMLHYTGPTTGGARNMPLNLNATSFPKSAYTTLYNWVLQMQTGGPVTSGPVVFECTDPNARSTSLSYTLTKNQYMNTIGDLFGSSVLNGLVTELSVLPEEIFDGNSHERSSALSPSKVEAYYNLANTISQAITSSNTLTTTVFGSCANGASPTANCIDGYLNGFAKKIFRRPLTTDEFNYGKQMANRGGVYKTNLKALLSLHLQHPSFIWRLEIGKTTQSSTTQFELTPYEVATRISYMAADTTPDAELMAAADANQLTNLMQVRSHALRLLQSENGKRKVRASLMRYSMSDFVQDFSMLPAELKQGIQLNGLSSAITTETEDFIDHVVYTQKGSFKTLLTSKASFASHDGLATIYGHSPVTSSSNPASMSGRRQGLLLRSTFLSWPSSRTGIIVRGVKFQKRVLCNEIPPPSTVIADLRDVDEFSHEEALLHTNREAVAHKTQQPLCMSCHATINPTGFAFEAFDAFGRIRTTEPIYDNGQLVRSLPLDTSSQVPLASGGTIDIQDAYDLVSFVADSPEGSACFSQNIFRFMNEKRESPEDSCALQNVQSLVRDSSKSVLDGLAEVIANDAIWVKKN